MAGKIFINYRRDDVPGDARGLREGLAAKFGKSAVFMDIDNLLAGQRFDKELEKALAQCDVLVAVIGPRWMDLLASRAAGGERDYVREEIAAALKRNITVIPVRVGREGAMAAFPRRDQLPEDIRDLVLHQKQDVAHERFGRDVAELVSAIRIVRQESRKPVAWSKIGLGSIGAVALVAALVLGVQSKRDIVPKKPIHVVVSAPDTEETKAARQAQQEEAERSAAALPKPGETFRDCPEVCPEMVVVPAGEFLMGSSDRVQEKPPHSVTIAKPFAVGRFEVTFDEWDACVAANGCKTNPKAD